MSRLSVSDSLQNHSVERAQEESKERMGTCTRMVKLGGLPGLLASSLQLRYDAFAQERGGGKFPAHLGQSFLDS